MQFSIVRNGLELRNYFLHQIANKRIFRFTGTVSLLGISCLIKLFPNQFIHGITFQLPRNYFFCDLCSGSLSRKFRYLTKGRIN